MSLFVKFLWSKQKQLCVEFFFSEWINGIVYLLIVLLVKKCNGDRKEAPDNVIWESGIKFLYLALCLCAESWRLDWSNIRYMFCLHVSLITEHATKVSLFFSYDFLIWKYKGMVTNGTNLQRTQTVLVDSWFELEIIVGQQRFYNIQTECSVFKQLQKNLSF